MLEQWVHLRDILLFNYHQEVMKQRVSGILTSTGEFQQSDIEETPRMKETAELVKYINDNILTNSPRPL